MKQKQADNRGLLHVTAVRSVWLELTPRDGAESSEANCPSHKATNTRCFQLVPKSKVRLFQFSVLSIIFGSSTHSLPTAQQDCHPSRQLRCYPQRSEEQLAKSCEFRAALGSTNPR
ncbi:uncharacterized protein ACIBXB_019934 [Morphnus guianensis]